MDSIEDPADAAVVLLNSLRVLSLAAHDQIALFHSACVACAVRGTFSRLEEEFSAAPFVAKLTPPQRSAVDQVRVASKAISKDPAFECSENRYVLESPHMEALRCAAIACLAAFSWTLSMPERSYTPGTQEFAERYERIQGQRKQERLSLRRMEPAVPRFHEATFQLHDHPLARNVSRLHEIASWEAEHELKLPAAVREWIEMEGDDLCESIIPRDYVYGLEEIEPLQPALVREGDEERFLELWARSESGVEMVRPVEHFKYLLVSTETDVGISCVVRVDGSDDPPVFLRPEVPEEPPLRLVSPSFTAYMFDRLADGEQLACRDNCIYWEAYHPLPNDEELAWLNGKLTCGPLASGGWFGWNHRFTTRHAFVACGLSIYQQDGPMWTVGAFGQEPLREVLTALEPIGDLVTKLTLGHV